MVKLLNVIVTKKSLHLHKITNHNLTWAKTRVSYNMHQHVRLQKIYPFSMRVWFPVASIIICYFLQGKQLTNCIYFTVFLQLFKKYGAQYYSPSASHVIIRTESPVVLTTTWFSMYPLFLSSLNHMYYIHCVPGWGSAELLCTIV